MKKYFNKKIFTAIIFCFLLLTTSSVFSLFYFSLNTSATIGGEENLLVDDIAENYNMDASDRLASDYYEVSFFPNPRAATASNADDIHNYYLEKYTDIYTTDIYTTSTSQKDLPGWKQVFYSGNDQATYGNQLLGSPGQEYIQENDNEKYYFGNYVYGTGTLFDGYWGNYVEKTDTDSEPSKPPVSSYVVKDTINFAKPIDRTVYQAVTPSLLYEIENTYQPATATRDQGEWPMTFNGWSYSQKVAANHGYGWQGDFKLYDFGMDLEAYDMMKPDGTIATEAEIGQDQPAIDGTLIGDHKVYLYAVYTSGKDYAQYIERRDGDISDYDYGSRFDSLRITKKDGGKEVTSKYMAFKPTQDGYKPTDGNIRTDYGYYYYNGLTIMPESNTSFDLAFGLANSKGWDGTWGEINHASQSELINLQGNYNVYVYLMKNNFDVYEGIWPFGQKYSYKFADDPNDPDAQYTEAYVRASEVEPTIDDNWLTAFVDGNNPILPEDLRSKITNKQIRKIIDTGFQNYYSNQVKNRLAIADFRAIILVERNYEFRLTGNLMHSFNYDDSEHVMYGSSSNGIVDTSTYYLERVYLSNNSNQLFNYHYNYEGESFNSLFKENVFTFHADRGRLNYKVSINNDVDYPYTTDYIQPASGTNDEAAFNNGNGEHDYYLPNNPNNIIESVDGKIGYNDKLLKFVGNTGYYDLKVKVEYSATNGQEAEINNVIVSVKPSKLKAFIKIYEDDLTERYESDFINHSAEPTYLVSSDTNHEFSTNITVNYDDKLFNNGTHSFKDIIDSLSEGEALINHVTQKPITENDFPMNIDKSYIFYIGTVE